MNVVGFRAYLLEGVNRVMGSVPQYDQAFNLDVLEDIAEDLSESRFVIEKTIASLDINPAEIQPIIALIKPLIALEAGARSGKILFAANLLATIKEIFSAIFDRKISYTPLLGEIILLSADQLYDAINMLVLNAEEVDLARIDLIAQSMAEIVQTDAAHMEQVANNILLLLTQQFLVEDDDLQASLDQQLIDRSIEVEHDLVFFRTLSAQYERRFVSLAGRSERMLSLARDLLRVDDVTGTIDFVQLEAAIYLYDIGMSLLPDDLLTKKTDFEKVEKEQLFSHPNISSGLLSRIPGWAGAAQIVQQHHEKLDGTGYPNHLCDAQICEGAKVLAILDAFDAMTRERAHRPYKKSIIRAVRELNVRSGQFSAAWVKKFNLIVKKRFVSVSNIE